MSWTYIAQPATFSWFDLGGDSGATSIPSMASADDVCAGFISMPFSFPFFGQTFNTVYINSNGMLTFLTGSNEFFNETIPSTNAPNLFIAPFWDDLESSCGPSPDGVYYRSFGFSPPRTFVVEWKNWDRWPCPSGSSYTFELILQEDGLITFQYLTMSDPGSATSGIENQDGTVGATNPGPITDGTAVRFLPPGG